MSFSSQKGEFDRFFNRLDRPVEESQTDRQPDRFPSLISCDGFEVEGGIVRNNASCTELGSIILWVVGFLPATKTQR